MKRTKKIAKALIVLFVIDLIVAQLWFKYVTVREAAVDLRPGDAAVVLMGDVANQYQALGPQTIKRLDHALQVKKDGNVKQFLCVGGYRPKRKFFGASLMKRYLIERGIEPFDVFIEPNSYDTRTNLKFASSIVREQGWKSITIISSPLHIHRVRKLAELKYLKGIKIQFSSYSHEGEENKLGFWVRIRRVHYEWMSYLIGAFPEPLYNRIVRTIREQNN